MRLFRSFIPLLLALAAMTAPSASFAQVAVGVSITIAPPVLPVYAQPPIPGPRYIWTPGYWAYGPYGYFWVPGTWVVPPVVGVLWTPGYWGWIGGVYVWHGGYWGPHIGYYGGINYGFGYVGTGYLGGYWAHGVFNYNTAVNNIHNVNITNTYNTTVVKNTTVTNVSYNGGTGGTTVQPTVQEQAAAREQHTPPTALQAQHEHAASTNHALLASVNHGRPTIAATSKPGVFSGRGITASRGANGNAPHPGQQHAHPPAHDGKPGRKEAPHE